MSPLAAVLAERPPAQGMPTPTVAPTDIAGIYRDSYNQQMEKYKTDMARQNAMWGGLAGLGGAGISAFGPAAAKGIGSLFGGGSAAAAAPTWDAAGAGSGFAGSTAAEWAPLLFAL